MLSIRIKNMETRMAVSFHEGERRMQALAGETAMANMNAPMISSRILKNAIPFLSSQTFVVLGFEQKQELWCGCLIGEPGFVSIPDQFRLNFDLGGLSAQIGLDYQAIFRPDVSLNIYLIIGAAPKISNRDKISDDVRHSEETPLSYQDGLRPSHLQGERAARQLFPPEQPRTLFLPVFGLLQ